MATRSIPATSAGRLVNRSKTCQTLPTPGTEGRMAGEPTATSMPLVRPAVAAARDVEKGEGGEGRGEVGESVKGSWITYSFRGGLDRVSATLLVLPEKWRILVMND